MKFATLFLIASAVLAMPTGQNTENVELAKKDAAPAGGFVFPTDDEDDPTSENYRFRNGDEQIPGKAWGQQFERPVKDRKDSKGNSCQNYRGNEVKDVPEECMKTVFCRNGDGTDRMGCDIVSFNINNWTKQKLLDDNVSKGCVSSYICKNEDWYNP